MPDMDSIKLISIVPAESDKEEYIPRTTSKKAAVKTPPVQIKVEKSVAVKAKENPVLGKPTVAVKTKPKRLNRNNV